MKTPPKPPKAPKPTTVATALVAFAPPRITRKACFGIENDAD